MIDSAPTHVSTVCHIGMLGALMSTDSDYPHPRNDCSADLGRVPLFLFEFVSVAATSQANSLAVRPTAVRYKRWKNAQPHSLVRWACLHHVSICCEFGPCSHEGKLASVRVGGPPPGDLLASLCLRVCGFMGGRGHKKLPKPFPKRGLHPSRSTVSGPQPSYVGSGPALLPCLQDAPAAGPGW